MEYKAFFSNNYEAKIPKEAKVNLKRLGLEEKKCGGPNKGLFEVELESRMSCKQLGIFFQILHIIPVNMYITSDSLKRMVNQTLCISNCSYIIQATYCY